MYYKEIKLKPHDTKGYLYFIDRKHPLANKSGCVYYHRHLMSLQLQRWLLPKEHVHHIDGNPSNNCLENLELITLSEHAKLHNPAKYNICHNCGKVYKMWGYRSKFCSATCATKDSMRFTVSKKELEKMVWESPTTEVAKHFNVSESAIAKRCKKFNISKPPRGYWQKLHAGKIISG